MHRSLWAQLVALVLALNYFAFQVELFKNEYEANHPKISEYGGFSLPTLTWESFDKDQAPQPISIEPTIQLEIVSLLAHPARPGSLAFRAHEPVRDKSPPSLSVNS